MIYQFMEMSISKIILMKLEHNSGHILPIWTYLYYQVASLNIWQKQLQYKAISVQCCISYRNQSFVLVFKTDD